MRLGRIVLHPVLFAAYPVLFLFANNAADQVSFDALWLPLGFATGGAVVLLGLMMLAFRDVHRGGLAATLLVVAFFAFGHVWNLVGAAIGNRQALLVAWIVAVVAGLVLVWRSRPQTARSATGPLNLLAAIPLVITMVSLGDFVVNRSAAGAVIASVGGLLAGDDRPQPDIYYLVFDRYAGSPTLERHFGFDNEPFLQELESRGFFVARNSVANYVKTNLSLTSTLNMEYLDAKGLADRARAPDDQGVINRDFQGRLVVPSSLKELGYEFVLIPSWWSPSAGNVDADVTLRYEGVSEFSLALYETTLLSAVTAPLEEADPFSMDELRNYTLHQLQQMVEAQAIGGPKFVFAHVLLPHPPNLFNRDGGPFEGDETSLSEDEKYLRQVEFANSEILRMLDEIEARDGDNPAIVVIQADEGPFPDRYRENGDTFRWDDATPEEMEIKFRILNAVRLPGVDASDVGFREGMTPVNTFRIVFNVLLDAGLPLLPDRVYAHRDLRHYYDFIEITDRIPGWQPPR